MKRTIILPTILLIVPVWALYVTYRAPEAPRTDRITLTHQPLAQSDSVVEALGEGDRIAAPVNEPMVPTRAAVLSKRQNSEDGVFHLCEEKGTLVYKIRLKRDGDELTVCAQTGKLLAIGDRWMPQGETLKKS